MVVSHIRDGEELEPVENPKPVNGTALNSKDVLNDYVVDEDGVWRWLEEFKGSNGGIKNYVSKEDFKTKLEKTTGTENAKILTDKIYEFRSKIDDNYEYSTAIRNDLKPLGIYTCYNKHVTGLPDFLRKEGEKESIYSVIHNHIGKQTIFPSPKDLKYYSKNGVKFGINTNLNGTSVIINNNVEKNKNMESNIFGEGKAIRKEVIHKFKEKTVNWEEYARDEELYYNEINRFVNKNIKEVIDIYNTHLEKYNIKLIIGGMNHVCYWRLLWV